MNKHHLIPKSLEGHPVLIFLRANGGFDIDQADNTLMLPSESKAAQAAGAALDVDGDANHVGKHSKYTKAVRALLDDLQIEQGIRDDGTPRPDKLVDINKLRADVDASKTLFASKLTSRVDQNGRVIGPEWALNNSDPRVIAGRDLNSFYSDVFDADGDVKGDAATKMRQDVFFKNSSDLRAKGLDFNSSDDGLTNYFKKVKAAKAAGINNLNGINIDKLPPDVLEKMGFKVVKGRLAALSNLIDFLKNDSGSAGVGGKFAGLSNKIGAVDIALVGLIALGVYQIAKEENISLQDLIDQLDLDISPELILDLAAGAMKMVFEYAALTILTGGVGTAVRFSADLLDSTELAGVTLQILNIAFPDWKIGESFLAAKDAVDGFFDPYWQGLVEKLMKVTFALSGAKVMTFADGNARETADDDERFVTKATDEIDYVIASGYSDVYGKDGNDWMFHSGTGALFGGSGDDILFGYKPDYIKAGEYITDKDRESADRNKFLAADQQIPIVGPKAAKDLTLKLDGGVGNDWVVTVLGEKAITIGGEGRDWIFNTSKGGIIFGDTENGLDAEGNPLNVDVEYGEFENSDNIWWWPGTRVMDAQFNDHLKFFGMPLTGGSEGVPLLVAGLAGFLGASLTDVSGHNPKTAKYFTEGRLFIDPFAIFMSYTFIKDKDDHLKMVVSNSLQGLLNLFGDFNFTQTGSGQSLDRQRR